jgi:hypothetical protein
MREREGGGEGRGWGGARERAWPTSRDSLSPLCTILHKIAYISLRMYAMTLTYKNSSTVSKET